ncbi:MAG: alpha/beta fold hydrolase [Clostridiales bacterium]|nr:alpha/beta fold hydrolase [Clostridiales bacterium]
MLQIPVIVGNDTPYPLKGMLTLPEGNGPFPAAVFVHGSGSSNMDEKVGKLTPFKDLAEGLAARGIASLRYDKRTFAHGAKLLRAYKNNLTVKEEVLEDALLAADLLRQDNRIDPQKVFIVGHSMGAMLAPRIHAEGGNFKGLVLMAGTLRTLETVLLDQIGELLKTSRGLTKRILQKQLSTFEKRFANLYALSDEEAKAEKYAGGVTLYYFKEMGLHPAEDYLKQLETPVLVLQGEKDSQVKADTDFTAYRELLQNHPDAAFKLYDGLNHAFVPALYEGIANARKEFAVERHIASEVLDDLASWIHRVSSN